MKGAFLFQDVSFCAYRPDYRYLYEEGYRLISEQTKTFIHGCIYTIYCSLKYDMYILPEESGIFRG